MGTKILKSENGGYYVATEENRPLTPPMSLEEAKQRKKAIDSYRERKNSLQKPQEPFSEEVPELPKNETPTKTKEPSYIERLGFKWKNDRVGKVFISTKPNRNQNSPPNDDKKVINTLLNDYIKYFGSEPPFPPEHIMESLVKLKKEGRFDDVIKSIGPIVGDLRKNIEADTGAEMGLNNPIFKTNFNEVQPRKGPEDTSTLNKLPEVNNDFLKWYNSQKEPAEARQEEHHFSTINRKKLVDAIVSIFKKFQLLYPDLPEELIIKKFTYSVAVTNPDIQQDIFDEALSIIRNTYF